MLELHVSNGKINKKPLLMAIKCSNIFYASNILLVNGSKWFSNAPSVFGGVLKA